MMYNVYINDRFVKTIESDKSVAELTTEYYNLFTFEPKEK